MKKIIITICNRLDSIDILKQYLYNQRAHYDEWHIWANTDDRTVLTELEKLEARIIIPNNSNPLDKLNNLHLFYKEDACDKSAMYIKFDDDIVWLEKDFIAKLFNYREQYANDYFLIFPNIINNAVLSNIHMRFGNIPWDNTCWYSFMDPTGWGNPLFAENLHKLFLKAIHNHSYNKWKFNRWNLDLKEQVSINCISWLGKDFATIAPTMTGPDEYWLNIYGQSLINKRSIIIGDPICVHYAFHTQKNHLDQIGLLEEYKRLVNSV